MGGAGTYPLTIVGEDGTLVEFGASELVLECTPPEDCESLIVTINDPDPVVFCYDNTPTSTTISADFSCCTIQWKIFRELCDTSRVEVASGSGLSASYLASIGGGEVWDSGQNCPTDESDHYTIDWWCGPGLDPETDPPTGTANILFLSCA